MNAEHGCRKEQMRRRRFIGLISTGAPLLLAGGGLAGIPSIAFGGEDDSEEMVSPGEDLMREHGVLKRVLLIYEEIIQRLENDIDAPPELISDSARIIQSFIEDYHEKLEEDYLFPRFRNANRLVDLVDTLATQHQAGRRLTDGTLKYANPASLRDPSSRSKLIISMRQFIRMYNPHEAREDTVLFPALREIVSRNEYDALGEDFERLEHLRFGEEGFEVIVARVADFEKNLGIYELGQFTPKE